MLTVPRVETRLKPWAEFFSPCEAEGHLTFPRNHISFSMVTRQPTEGSALPKKKAGQQA